MENTNEIQSFRPVVICSFQMTFCGRIRIIMSVIRLKVALNTSSAFRSMHFPGNHLCQSFSRGMHAREVAIIPDRYINTLASISIRAIQKNES